jgi:hypothetical protein
VGELFCVVGSGEESGLSGLAAEVPEETGRPEGEVCSCADILKIYCPSKLLRDGSEGLEPRYRCAASDNSTADSDRRQMTSDRKKI